MDSNTSSFIFNSSSYPSVFYQNKEDVSHCDLGLSLRTLEPEADHPRGQLLSLGGYGDLMDWPPSNTRMTSSTAVQSRLTQENNDEDAEGVQSKEKWAYVKVNMDGISIGRKICIVDHDGYSSLAVQLEEMFGTQTVSGLRLFQATTEYMLLYKDRGENWRAAGDVPWKEFVESVQRLRIARSNAAVAPR